MRRRMLKKKNSARSKKWFNFAFLEVGVVADVVGVVAVVVGFVADVVGVVAVVVGVVADVVVALFEGEQDLVWVIKLELESPASGSVQKQSS